MAFTTIGQWHVRPQGGALPTLEFEKMTSYAAFSTKYPNSSFAFPTRTMHPHIWSKTSRKTKHFRLHHRRVEKWLISLDVGGFAPSPSGNFSLGSHDQWWPMTNMFRKSTATYLPVSRCLAIVGYEGAKNAHMRNHRLFFYVVIETLV